MTHFHVDYLCLNLSALKFFLPSVTIFCTGTPVQTFRISFEKIEQNYNQQAANYVHSPRK